MSTVSHLHLIKQHLWHYFQAINQVSPDNMASVLAKYFHPHASIHLPHPFNHVAGIDDYERKFWRDFLSAFDRPTRREHILISGHYDQADWVSVTGEYSGTFVHDWLGIPATHQLTHIRYGEFYQVVDHQVTACFILFDIIDVMQQAGIHLLPPSLGTTQRFPAPATQDGVVFDAADSALTKRALTLVEDMIFVGLRDREPNELISQGAERYWHPHMLWYGPAAIGSTRGIDGFQNWHQQPFIKAFPDRVGGDHKARFAEGNYVASTGWPSIQATHTGPGWLGLAATGKSVTMRVMDFWRCQHGKLVENWVFIDIPDLFNQLGDDLMDRMALHLQAHNGRG